MDSETIRQVFIRIAKDADFKMPFDQVAALTAEVCEIHPLELLNHFPYLYRMQSIADGTDPILEKDK